MLLTLLHLLQAMESQSAEFRWEHTWGVFRQCLLDEAFLIHIFAAKMITDFYYLAKDQFALQVCLLACLCLLKRRHGLKWQAGFTQATMKIDENRCKHILCTDAF